MSVDLRPTNGVSFGAVHTVTSAEGTAGAVVFDFQVDYNLAAVVQVVNSSGVVVDISDAVITYPAEGQVSIADGQSTYTTTATDVISIVAQRRSSES